MPADHNWFPDETSQRGRLSGLLVIETKNVVWYRVDEVEVGKDFEGRGFTLKKMFGGTDRSMAEYQTFVTAPYRNGYQDSCSCRGWLSQRHCKHLTVMKQLAQGGRE